jgi:hypothetical protein
LRVLATGVLIDGGVLRTAEAALDGLSRERAVRPAT